MDWWIIGRCVVAWMFGGFDHGEGFTVGVIRRREGGWLEFEAGDHATEPEFVRLDGFR